MLRKLTFSVLIPLLLVSALTLAFNVRQAGAEGVIHIGADGSITGTTSIQTVDNVTYFFRGDINGSIVIERDHAMLDGAGHTLQGGGAATGIELNGRTNVTVDNLQITGFNCGLNIENCTNVTVSENNIVRNGAGILFYAASSNIDVFGNNITANRDGIRTDGSTWNDDAYKVYRIYHNNFVNNTDPRSSILGWVGAISWNLSYPAGGNFWSDYNGLDSKSGAYQNESGSDGIGDSTYIYQVDWHMATYLVMVADYYPLTVPFGSNMPLAYPVANFNYAPNEPIANETVEFNASISTCPNGTIGLFKWDFGDGKTATGPTVTHVYETQGDYQVTLTIVSNTLIPDTKNQSIYVALVPSWQTWTIFGLGVASAFILVSISLILFMRRAKRKKTNLQAKLPSRT